MREDANRLPGQLRQRREPSGAPVHPGPRRDPKLPRLAVLIVANARTWIDVPFKHQGRTRAGVDCIGLLYGVAWDLRLPAADVRNYSRVPHPRRMGEELERQMDRIAIGALEPGDVAWFAWRREPQHVAIFTGDTIIHATEALGRVVEHPIDRFWLARVRGAFRFREAA